ncbi:hypothetical protein F5X68DRAFT_201757 [Plectosphaerella plurivora]|uniref:Uncharacterized protein n=1 Tax=Plectosphaerella plurivora TaxID=936078 RepID=A0A9P9ADH1_9PEZI|nr:hypothetical protein F5X68DRAFT_201757 [Plectosphaerella plurivora]
MARQTFFVCLLLSAVSFSSAAGRCYYPNGAQSFDNFPCDVDAEDGPCCHGSQGWACLDNKLCRGPDGNVVRGSCSDPTWDSPECSHFCLSASTGGTDLISCSNVTGIDTSYCCDHTVNCCNSGVGRFDVLPSEPQVVATWNRASSQYITVPTSSKASSTSSAPESTPTTLVSTSAAPSSTPSEETSQSAAPAESTSGPTSGGSEGEMSIAVKAGIGAGAGAGAILVAVIVYLLLKVRRNKRQLQESRAAPQVLDVYQAYPRYPDPPPHEDTPGKWAAWHDPDVKETRPRPAERMEMDGRPRQPHWTRVELPAD